MNDNIAAYKDLLCRKDNYQYICMFGAGYAARYWYNFITYLGFKIDFFSDNKSDMWGKIIVDGISCISPEELYGYGKEVLCLISTSSLYINEISAQLNARKMEVIRLDPRWFNIKNVIEHYLNMRIPEQECTNGSMGEYSQKIKKNERIAVYTCVIGGYDDLKQPKVVEEECDYFYLSLEKPENLGVYKWIDISGVVPSDISDNVRLNRFCKINPHLFFREYKYSIYHDGSFEIIHSIRGLVDKIGNIGIGMYEGGGLGNPDIYGEAAALMASRRLSGDSAEIIRRQIARYIREGVPRNFGDSSNGIIVREHNNPKCQNVMETWWNEVKNESRRDQLSFWYAVWKNGYLPQDVGSLGKSSKINSEFRIYSHKINIYGSGFHLN